MESYYQNLHSDYYEASASSKATNLKLVFLDEVASPVFTKEKISGKLAAGCDGGHHQSIRIMLVDSKTQQNITTGPAASAKVKLVLVHGDVGGGNVSTSLDFRKNIVVDWRKKKNLLLGDLYLDLKNGSGTVGEIRIKHDRNPLSNVRFRLGAMVVGCRGYEIQEAITNTFEVKDRRNVPKYTGPLSPTDEVWQLKNIAKKGPIHKRLENSNIFTVRDFLNMHYSNPQALQEICRVKGKKWEKTVDHAKTCLVKNIAGRVGSSSQPSHARLSSFDYDGSIEFDSNCYKPQPLDDDQFGNRMIFDSEFSTGDVEVCDDVYFHGSLEPCEEDEVCGDEEGKGAVIIRSAKKRWMKLRTLWFSIASFMNKCVGAALVG